LALALPLTSCGLRLSDEAVRVAVSLRLGLSLCVPHNCRCRSFVDASGVLAFVCKKAPSRTIRHHGLNDIVFRAVCSSGVPATKEPAGLFRQDGTRPDGLSLIPWQSGKPLTWDVTVVCPLAQSYIDSAAKMAAAVAEQAATRKSLKYCALVHSHIFQPFAVENTGAINASACTFVDCLGKKLCERSGDTRETLFLFQRISMLVQRFNSVLLHETFVVPEEPDM
jgi:hypothetical protein